MATLKLKKKTGSEGPREARPPVRGMNTSLRPRPTLADKEARRAERAARGQGPGRSMGERGQTQAWQEQAAPRRNDMGNPSPSRPSSPQGRSSPRPEGRPSNEWQPPVNTAFSPRNSAFEGTRSPHAERRPLPPAQPLKPFARPTQQSMPRVSPRDEVRLSKRMSELGIASRREADEWIAKGWVRVDGKIVNELGSRVRVGQLITVDTPAKFHQARKVTILLNKPVGYVSGQAEDGHEPAWVLIKPESQWREDGSGIRFLREHTRSLAPAGRLDIDSVGLLVMTQDGRVAKQLIGEDSLIEKEYLVRVAPTNGGPRLSSEGLALLNHGLWLDEVELKPALVEWVNDDQLRFVLREGRKRQIRRMCEAVKLQVLGLKRVRIGNVNLGNLPPGQWRYLRLDENFGAPPARGPGEWSEQPEQPQAD